MAKQPKKNKKRQLELEKKKRHKRQAKLAARQPYTRYTHPRGVFELEYPSHWEHAEEDDGNSIGFGPCERDNVAIWFYLVPHSMDVETIVDSPDFPDFYNKLFEEMEVVNPRRDSTIAHYAVKADVTEEEKGGNFWIIAGCDIIMSASTGYPDGEQHLWDPEFERLLSTLRICRETEAVLSKAIMRLVRKLEEEYPDEEFKMEDQMLKGKTQTLPLGNLLTQIRQRPEDFEAITDHFFSATIDVFKHPLGREKLDDVRDDIFPFIRPDTYGQDLTDDPRRTQLAHSPWLADLMLAYVIRMPSGFRYITEWDLNRWKIDVEELHRTAIDNIASLKMPEGLPERGANKPAPMVVISAEDNMDASRILHPHLHQAFSPVLGRPFLAAIPNRDSLMLFQDDKKLRRKLQRQVREDFKQSSYAITDRLFLVTADGVTLAEW